MIFSCQKLTRRRRQPDLRTSLIVVVLLFFATEMGNAQDRLIEKFPVTGSAIFWTDEAPVVVDAFLDLLDDQLLQTPLAKRIEDIQATRSNSDDELGNSSMLDSVLDTVAGLRDGIFDNEAMWIYHRETRQTVIIAHSSWDAERIDEWIEAADIASRHNSIFTAGRNASRSNLNLMQPSETRMWHRHGEWVFYSRTTRMVEWCLGWMESTDEERLVEDRSFQVVHSTVQKNKQDWPSIHFHLTPELTLPFINRFKSTAHTLFGIEPNTMTYGASGQGYGMSVTRRQYGLDTVRGIGGLIYLPSRALEDELGALMAIDCHMSVSQPRKQFAALVRKKQGLDFSFPVIDKRIVNLVQMELDGNELPPLLEGNERSQSAGAKTSGFRTYGSSGTSQYFPRHAGIPFTYQIESPSNEFLKSIRRFNSVGFEQDRPQQKNFTECWTTVELEDSSDSNRVLLEMLNEEREASWVDEVVDGQRIFRFSESAMQSNAERVQAEIKKSIQASEASAKQYEADGTEEGKHLARTFREGIAQTKERMGAEIERINTLVYFQEGKWFNLHPIREGNQHLLAETNAAAPREQLDQLQEQLELMRTKLGTDPCGLFVQWSEQVGRDFRIEKIDQPLQGVFQASLDRLKNMATRLEKEFTDDIRRQEFERIEAWLEINRAHQEMVNSIDKSVMTINENATGYRFVGVLFKRSNEDE